MVVVWYQLVLMCGIESNTGRKRRRVEEKTDSLLLPVGASDPARDVRHVSAAGAALALSQST